jgi:predicted  nucleic acid-binding Zn-ribbon protein
MPLIVQKNDPLDATISTMVKDTTASAATKDDVEGILRAIVSLEEKTTASIATLDGKIDTLDQKTTANIAALDGKIDALDQKTTASIATLDGKIDSLDQKTTASIATLDGKIDTLDQKTNANIAALDQKIDDRFDDVLGVMDVMMTRIDSRFNKVETDLVATQEQVHNILNRLDGIDKRLEISEDERLVMAHQLSRLHDWVERAAERIDVKFAH